MANVDETDSSLATKCLAFCQALSSQGKAFQFSLNIGSTFSFTLDTRCKETGDPLYCLPQDCLLVGNPEVGNSECINHQDCLP